MATTAAEPARPLLAAAALGVVLAACIRPEAGGGVPLPVPAAPGSAPEIVVGLADGRSAFVVGGMADIEVQFPDGGIGFVIPAGESVRLRASAGGVAVGGGSRTVEAARLQLAAREAGTVRLDGREYPGTVVVTRGSAGLAALNRVPVEEYLVGVVAAELGRREPGEAAALRAQAILARTFALRQLGRRRADGSNVAATEQDQVYAGVGVNSALARAAVEATRGVVVTYAGQLADVFYSSTCGGRTEDGVAAFRGADRPYLRSVSDLRPDGMAWCAASPRYRWRESWTAAELSTQVARGLAQALGGAAPVVRSVRDVQVAARTPSGRVAAVTVVTDAGPVRVDGQPVRQALRTATGEPLRSTDVELRAIRQGGRLVRLEAEGRGAGHGVGFCQWGAIGRARAGQSHEQIIAAYFPGTSLERRY